MTIQKQKVVRIFFPKKISQGARENQCGTRLLGAIACRAVRLRPHVGYFFHFLFF
jgi:hypothetical protein